MKHLQKLIHKKRQQSNNSAYSISARNAIKHELKQLLEIRQAYEETANRKIKLMDEVKHYKKRIFHFELLVVALLGISPKTLGTYLNIYPISVLTAHFKGTTPTLEMCNKLEEETKQLNKPNQIQL